MWTKKAFEAVCIIIDSENQAPTNVVFVDAPGGTGKTFLFNTTLARLRSKTKICLALASSGIASILLTGGVALVTLGLKYR